MGTVRPSHPSVTPFPRLAPRQSGTTTGCRRAYVAISLMYVPRSRYPRRRGGVSFAGQRIRTTPAVPSTSSIWPFRMKRPRCATAHHRRDAVLAGDDSTVAQDPTGVCNDANVQAPVVPHFNPLRGRQRRLLEKSPRPFFGITSALQSPFIVSATALSYCGGRLLSEAETAARSSAVARTASAPCPASGGPFLSWGGRYLEMSN
jgi:hypothetical protein